MPTITPVISRILQVLRSVDWIEARYLSERADIPYTSIDDLLHTLSLIRQELANHGFIVREDHGWDTVYYALQG